MKRSVIDGRRLEKFGDIWYKLSEPDHLGFCEVIEVVKSLEDYRSYEKIILNSSYGVYVQNAFPLVTNYVEV